MSEQNPYAAPQSNLNGSGNGLEQHELATRGARFGGAIIDAVLSMLLMFPLLYLFGFWTSMMEGQGGGLIMMLMLGVMGLVVFLVLHGYFLAKDGQTIGKKLVGTRIVSVENNQILPLSKVFLLRYLPVSVVSSIPAIGSLLALVNVLFIFGKERRCLHDLVAGTKVVKVNPSQA